MSITTHIATGSGAGAGGVASSNVLAIPINLATFAAANTSWASADAIQALKLDYTTGTVRSHYVEVLGVGVGEAITGGNGTFTVSVGDSSSGTVFVSAQALAVAKDSWVGTFASTAKRYTGTDNYISLTLTNGTNTAAYSALGGVIVLYVRVVPMEYRPLAKSGIISAT